MINKQNNTKLDHFRVFKVKLIMTKIKWRFYKSYDYTKVNLRILNDYLGFAQFETFAIQIEQSLSFSIQQNLSKSKSSAEIRQQLAPKKMEREIKIWEVKFVHKLSWPTFEAIEFPFNLGLTK